MKQLMHYILLLLLALQVSSCKSCDQNNRFQDPVQDCGCPTSAYMCSNDSCYCPQGTFNDGSNCWPRDTNELYTNLAGCIYNGEASISAWPNRNGDENYGNFELSLNSNPGGGLLVSGGASFGGNCKYIARPEGDSIYNDFIPTRILKAGITYEPVVHGHFSRDKDTLFAIFNWHRVLSNGNRGGRVCRHGAQFIKHR